MRKLLVFALLLVAAPAARAENPVPAPAPNLQVVEVAAPVISQSIKTSPAFVEELKPETRAAQVRMGGTTTAILLVLAAIGLIVLVRAL